MDTFEKQGMGLNAVGIYRFKKGLDKGPWTYSLSPETGVSNAQCVGQIW